MPIRSKGKLTFPLTKEDVSVLLLLEEDLSKNSSEKTVAKKLMAIYSQLVEFYDFKKDPIKAYFIDKLQSVIYKANSIANVIPADNYIAKLKNKFESVSKLLKPETKRPKLKSETKNVEQMMEVRRSKKNFEVSFADKYKSKENEAKKELKKDL